MFITHCEPITDTCQCSLRVESITLMTTYNCLHMLIGKVERVSKYFNGTLFIICRNCKQLVKYITLLKAHNLRYKGKKLHDIY